MKRTILVLGILIVSASVCVFSYAQNPSSYAYEEHQRQRYRQKYAPPKPSLNQLKSGDEEQDIFARQLEIITGMEDTRYTIVPGDTLTVSYQDKGKVESGVYQVSKEGEIHMPLIGAVKVGGLNRKQARALIHSSLSEYIRHPNAGINVNVAGRYMVVGAGGPGVYDLSERITVMEAILLAGYNEKKANLKSVLLMRGSVDNPVVQRLNLSKMMKKGDRSDNLSIKPGDIVYIPTSYIYHLETFKDNMFKLLLDYYTLGGLQPLTQTQKQTVNQD